jgi:LysM repeat protein
MRLQDYSDLIYKKPAPGYRDNQIVAHSYYKKPIDHTEGRLAGVSRRVGHADHEVQKQVIDIIIDKCEKYGLSNRQCAYVLATARHESGFNPDAAAGTTSALGIGQFVRQTAKTFGLTDKNSFDADAQADALVRLYLYNSKIANSRNKGEEYIYKYHHDGETEEHGGLKISQKHVMPWVDKIEKKLNKELGHAHEEAQNVQKDNTTSFGERAKDFLLASSAAELAESENAVIASKTLSERLSSMVSGITDFFSKSKSADYATKNTAVKESATVKPEVRSSKNGADSKDHDKAARLNANLEAKEGLLVQEVKDGDTLGKIAKEHGKTVKEIMDANPQIKDKNRLYAGERIYLPHKAGSEEHNEEHAQQSEGIGGSKESEEWAREFKKLAPDATPEQTERAEELSAAAREILSKSNKNPEEQAEALTLFHKDIAANINKGRELPPVQIYDPEAEPTRVVRSFTLEELQKDRNQEKGIERQREMQFGI